MGLRQLSVDSTDNDYKKPGNVSKKQAFNNFLYNRETGSVCGRTPSSWAKIIIFYLVFYTVLISFTLFCYFVFALFTVDPRVPKLKMEQSCIGINPGMGFRPTSVDHDHSTLIEFTGADKSTYNKYLKQLKTFVTPYKKGTNDGGKSEHVRECNYDTRYDPTKACIFSLREINNCTEQEEFGFLKGTPCFFLKLNKIYNWRPEFYNNTAEFPKNMPESLKKAIRDKNYSQQAMNQVWISCEGLLPPDKLHLKNIQYITDPGIPSYYFPFTNVEGYQTPLVVIKIFDLPAGVALTVECKAWAKNIKHSSKDKAGLIQFELLKDYNVKSTK